jgi:ABC-type uncharacterized transport system substrate-binding protein
MFFANRYTLEVQQDRLVGVWVDWIFDVYFTQEICFDYDLDSSGDFDDFETQEIHDNAFINLAKYNYFQLIRQGNQRYKVEAISQFQVFVEEEHMVYRFFITLDDFPQGEIYLATYDPTFFCAIAYAEDNPVQFSQPGSFNYTLEENSDFPVYYDPWGAPSDNPIYEQWKPGLETYIPVEAYIWHE